MPHLPRSFRWLRTPTAIAALATLPAAAGAQILQVPPPPPTVAQTPVARHTFGVDFTVGQPLGEFSDHIDEGYGASGNYVLRLDRRGIVGLRVDAGFLVYERESYQTCIYSGDLCWDDVEVSTMSSIAYGGIGPQFQMPRGAVRPYVAVTGGFTHFMTRSTISSPDDQWESESRTHQDDAKFAWGGSGGLLIPLRAGRQRMMIDLGVRYHGNGRGEYLDRQRILDLQNGSTTVPAIRSETNLLTWHIGVAFGIR